jgi:hypothetical protein
MRDLRERLTKLVEKWEASVGYGQGGTEQHRGAIESCIVDVRALLARTRARSSSPAPETAKPSVTCKACGREARGLDALGYCPCAAAPAPRPEETRPGTRRDADGVEVHTNPPFGTADE